jgi:preprotein translocase subunit SecD
MLNFSRYKISTILIICFFALYYSVGVFISQNHILKKIFPDNNLNLGLDLQGGSQLTLEIDFESFLNDNLNIVASELRMRFRKNNIRAIIKKNENISLRIYDNTTYKEIKKIIKDVNKNIIISKNKVGYLLSYKNEHINKMKLDVLSQSIEIIRRRVDETGTKEPAIQAQGRNRILLQVPGIEDSSQLKKIIGKTAKMTFHFVKSINYSSVNTDPQYMVLSGRDNNSYLVNKEVILSGDLLTDANSTYYDGSPAVGFNFNAEGSRKFASITRNNINKIFAIILDGEVITAPRINTPITQGSGVITGNFTVNESRDLALLLRAGALPAPLKIIEERTVGPSLGNDSILSGTIAALTGLFFVIFAMGFYYKRFGMFANISLIINIALIIALLAIIGANLTLPGIAGIVLTIGMAVDSNVLIFERIREEVAGNKSVIIAIDSGFKSAYRTIFDSNITTLIVAASLFFFGNGPVKGFAATLSIGIISSMFSAIMLTRFIISFWLRKNKSNKPSYI